MCGPGLPLCLGGPRALCVTGAVNYSGRLSHGPFSALDRNTSPRDDRDTAVLFTLLFPWVLHSECP